MDKLVFWVKLLDFILKLNKIQLFTELFAYTSVSQPRGRGLT
jgi:hypothetical protein